MIIQGDAYTVLKRMDDECIHMAVTSSPYYGLRSYGTEPVIWDDGWKGELGQEPNPEMFVRHLTTIFHELKRVLRNDGIFWMNIGDSYSGSHGNGYKQSLQTTNGAYSSDKNYDLAKQNNRNDGNCKPKDLIGIPWMLAFSMRSDGAASPQTMLAVEKIKSSLLQDYDTWNDVPKHTKRTIEDLDEEWLKASKGGWYLRADIPWIKRNSMPSSVTDRPSSSIEHVFLFSKSGDTQFWSHPELSGTRTQPAPDYRWKDKQTGEILLKEPQNWKTQPIIDESKNIVYKNNKPELRYKRFNLWDGHDYFYDHISTMQQSSESYNKDKRPRGVIRQCVNENSKYPDAGQFKKQDGTGNNTYTGFNSRYEPNSFGLRYMRDSDFFFKTWQGLLHNEDGEPMALVVNPRGYKGSHFAAYPIRLVEPLILAGTSEKGVCPHCGAPWVRITKKGEFINQSWGGEHVKGQEAVGGVGKTSCLKTGGTHETITVDWKPTCSCIDNIPVPATVIDPFSGSSATGVACKLHNRTYIGIELNPEYVKLGEQRLKDCK